MFLTEANGSTRIFGKAVWNLEIRTREDIKAVRLRIAALQKSDLDDADDQFLDLLQRRTVWTQRQLLLLGRIEQDYGIC